MRFWRKLGRLACVCAAITALSATAAWAKWIKDKRKEKERIAQDSVRVKMQYALSYFGRQCTGLRFSLQSEFMKRFSAEMKQQQKPAIAAA